MVEVLIPFDAGGCRHRRRALDRCLDLYADWAVVIAPGPRPWSKAAALMPALERSRADVVIVADADCLLDLEALRGAVSAVEAGAPWAIPHNWVLRLSRGQTERIYAGELETITNLGELERRPYVGWEGGGFLVARPETLLEVPPDPRFIGWGGEDESWARALRTLAGAPARGKADLWHLWHPPAERMSDRIGSAANMRLVRRYAAARKDPTAMRRILDEAKGAG